MSPALALNNPTAVRLGPEQSGCCVALSRQPESNDVVQSCLSVRSRYIAASDPVQPIEIVAS